ncbi:histidine-type phosphatase [Niastella sp. OAS944]|uniref:histidine-type phosphatase n=1 Tax=Niastella sp. OAS944 TaxID=2664089 RepID=UPI0034995362|nr:hypothetical protein [Chitinophagaceae bacterium OAS944]
MAYLIRTYIVTSIILSFLSIKAQSKQLYAGTKTPYPTPAQQYTPPPAGFKPVFVNHVGRHGSRFLTKAGSDQMVFDILNKAQSQKALTPLGQQLLGMTEHFVAIQKENYENITGLGKEEQACIAKRMLNNYADAFKGNGLEIVATHKVRTQQSASAFLTSFNNYKGNKQSTIVPDSLDTTLRFYDLSPAYQAYKKSAAVSAPVDSLLKDAKTATMARAICKRIFKQGFAIEPVNFTIGLYDMYCGRFSITEEMKQHGFTNKSIDFSIAFNSQQLQWLDFINGAEDFYEKGAARDTLGIQATVAAPLLNDFIKSTSAIVDHTKQEDAILRFTHAEAISPFATLLGIPQASVPAASVYEYNKHWSAAAIIPLSANIQWIVYSNGTEYLVKALLNEKEVSLPVPTNQWPYYKWADLNEYYLRKLKKLN